MSDHVQNAQDKKNSKRQKEISWALYDWANSSFSTTIMAGFFPVFFKKYWSLGVDPTVSTARLGIILSISSFIIAIFSPILGVIADTRSLKKLLVFLFMIMGVLASCALGFISEGEWQWAALAYTFGMIGFTASCVYYDAMLPAVSTDHDSDRVSSLGYAMGYLGGGILFLINVLWYLAPEKWGFHDGVQAVKASFISVAIWWLLFSIPLFKNVPEPKVPKSKVNFLRAVFSAMKSLAKTFNEIFKNKNLFWFLAAYWLYIDGVYTVMKMAVDYGISLGFQAGDLITALLITQFVGFPFAIFFGRIAGKFGCRVPIIICIAIYCFVVIGAVQMNQVYQFYLMAVIIGMVQGGVQALSRSLFSKLIPKESSGEYFGLFNLVGKFASIMGPALVALVVMLSEDSRKGMYGILVLFVLGAGLQFLVKEPETKEV